MLLKGHINIYNNYENLVFYFRKQLNQIYVL